MPSATTEKVTGTPSPTVWLSGWVRNTEDGRVELVAEGRPEDLDAFRRWLAEGPPGARVEKVEARPVPATGLFRSFRISH